MAGGHAQSSHPAPVSSLSPRPTSFYSADTARWYHAMYAWKRDDVDFYLKLAREWAGEGGAVLELAAGEGRVALRMARAGFRVTAVDATEPMLEIFQKRLDAEPAEVRDRIDLVHDDMRDVALDRLFRFIYLPFNTFLALSEPRDRYRMLERVREHLAPSGAFAFEVFTPMPRLLVDEPEWRVELDHDADDDFGDGRVHVLREVRSSVSYAEQLKRIEMRTTITRDGEEVAHWIEPLVLAFIWPRELELLLERQGFKIRARYGSAEMTPYAPTIEDLHPQFVVAQIEP